MYAIRQTIVRHIITVSPDVSQLFHDEEGYKKPSALALAMQMA